MTTEQRAELPAGYIWKDLQDIGAQFPMPDSWFFMGLKVEDTHAFFMTRESIRQDGIFTTGVTINAFSDFEAKTGVPVADFAKGYLKRIPLLLPYGEISTFEDESLVICKRRFLMPVEQLLAIPSFHGNLVYKQMPPSHFYTMAAGNRDTDTAYIVLFETPSTKWKNDRPIAETMINSAIFTKES